MKFDKTRKSWEKLKENTRIGGKTKKRWARTYCIHYYHFCRKNADILQLWVRYRINTIKKSTSTEKKIKFWGIKKMIMADDDGEK